MPKGQYKRKSGEENTYSKDPKKGLLSRHAKKDLDMPVDLRSPGHGHPMNVLIKAQRLNDVINMILDGVGNEEIVSYIIDKYKLETVEGARGVIIEANKEIMSMSQWKVAEVIGTHVERYETIYHQLIKLNARSFALAALKQKEKLIGLLKTDTTSIHINSNGSANLGYSVNYDPKKLNEGQQNRVEQLLSKMEGK